MFPAGSGLLADPLGRVRTLRRAVGTHGVAGTGRRVAERVRQKAWVSESHVWYELPAGHRAALNGDIRLEQGDDRHIHALSALPTHVTPDEARRRLDSGCAQLWIAWQGDEPIFACWVFDEDAPVAAAPGGTLSLPAETVVVEDVATAYRHHGRGIAPTMLAALGMQLGRGRRSVIAKVEQDNRASRRAFRKAGFKPVAWMHRRERGTRTAVEVEPQRNTRNARFLRDSLARS